MKAVLTILNGPQSGRKVLVHTNRLVVGRMPDCDVVLDAESISRRHACVFQGADGFYLDDLNSRNGTFLNGQRVRTATKLQHGDKIRLFEVLLSFAEPDGPLRTAAVRPSPDETVAIRTAREGRNPALSETLAEIDLRKFEKLRRYTNAELSLKAVIEITRRLQTWMDVDEVLNRILESLFGIFSQLDRGCILLVADNSDQLLPAAIRHRNDGNGPAETMRPIRQSVARRVLAEGKAVLSVEPAGDEQFTEEQIKEDGSVFDLQNRSYMCAPLIGASGRSLGVIFVDTDESGELFSADDLDVLACVAFLAGQAVEQATLQTKRYRAVVDTAVDGIVTTDDAGTIESVNPALLRLLSYERSELIGRGIGSIIPSDPETGNGSPRISPFPTAGGDQPGPQTDARHEALARRKNGSTVPIHLSVGRFQLDGREHFTGILHDITEQKLAEEKLRQWSELLERRVQVRTEHMRLLQDVAVIANEAESVGRAFHAALERVRAYLNWPVGHTYLRSPDDPERLLDTGVWSFDDPDRYVELMHATQKLIGEEGLRIVDRVFATGRPEWHTDISAGTDLLRRDVLAAKGLKTVFVVPILMGTTVVGVFEFFASKVKQPEPVFLNLMKHVGTQLGRVVERQHLQQELIDAVWNQQRRFGQELHDTLGQQLTGIGMMAQSLARKLAAQQRPEAALVSEIAAMIQQAKQDGRQLAKGMFPVEVDAEGLRAALEELAETTRERYELQCKLKFDSRVDIRDNNVATHLFRIAQEAVTNAVKHSAGSRLEILLSVENSVPVLVVRDNGKGLSPPPVGESAGMGLRIMKYRANAIGAELSVQPADRGGTIIKCLVQGVSRK
jgi:PAS domain S-box-containing protein